MKQGSSKNAVPTAAKIIGMVSAILCIAGILGSVISACLWGLSLVDWKEERYVIKRLSAESNIRGDEEDYIFWRGNQITLYTLGTGETTEYNLESTEAAGRSGLIIGTKLYSVVNQTVRRFDLERQTDEEILSEEDIGSMCGLTAIPDELSVTIKRTRKNWLLTIDGYEEEARYYICPIDGNMKTDCVEVNTLFSQ